MSRQNLNLQITAAEDILNQVKGCPHCKGCANMARIYFDNLSILREIETSSKSSETIVENSKTTTKSVETTMKKQ